MTPRLALCFPAHASGAELLRRTVYALRAQTAAPHLFEVVVGADGGDPDGVLRAAVGEQPFACRVVDSPRPGGDIPHRNHARNAAWRAAEAPLCAMLDADLCLEPCFVEHLLHEHDAALRRGAPAIFSPVMVGFGGVGPGDWLKASSSWAADGDGFAAFLARWPQADATIYSGYAGRHTPGPPASETLSRPVEGMPILWRGLLEALGGFSEEFIGWGGDKEELVERLKGLHAAGLFDMRLLTSARAWHQPHGRDPHQDDPDVRARQKYREARTRDIRTGARWWKADLARIAPLIPEAVAAAAPDGLRPEEQTAIRVQDLAGEVANLLKLRLPHGEGGLCIVGPGSHEIAGVVGSRLGRSVAAGAEAVQAVHGGRESAFAGVVVVDTLHRMEEGAAREALANLQRSLTRSGVLMLFEVAPGNGAGGKRPPRWYERACGAKVLGQRHLGGPTLTVMVGRR